MKLDLKQPELSIRNEYTLQLFDEDNNLLQEVKCHNAASGKKYIEYCILDGLTETYLGLGSGTGIINIEEDNHPLFKQSFKSSIIPWQRITREPSFINNHYQASITFPPTTSYVGALTEIGILVRPGSKDYCISHSLLSDAEGNPIVVKKTSTNILIVKIDMFISVELLPQPYNFKYFPAWSSKLAGIWYGGIMYPNNSFNSGLRYETNSSLGTPSTLITHCFLSPYYCGEELEQENILKYPVPVMAAKSYSSNNYMYLALSWPDGKIPISASTVNRRWNANDNNISFAHSIVFPGVGAISLPNHDICPPYEYKNIIVGTGDGATITFLPYINEVVSAIGYINGEASESTFINFDPRKSPLWNKCIKLVANTDEYEIPSYQLKEEYDYNDKSHFLGFTYQCCPALLSEKTHTKGTPGINSSNGSYYIYYDEQGITLDHARIGGNMYYTSTYGSYYRYNKPVTLFYSEDGEQWTQAIKIEESYKVFYFDRVTAKYWKILFGLANDWGDSSMSFLATFSTAEQWSKNQFTQRGMDPKFFVAGDSQEFDFGKCGITFATAPPEGAVITMDAVLDLPYKDTDIIMTMTVEAEQPNPKEVTV